VTGVFGMNVGGMPWTQDPHGFSHMLFMMALVLAVTLALIGRARMR